MKMGSENNKGSFLSFLEISDADVIEAMKEIGGYLDITPGDVKEVLKVANRQAIKRIASAVRARDIMVREVYAVQTSTPVPDVVDLMADKKISGLPVLSGDRTVAGVISVRDFLRRMGTGDAGAVMSLISDCLRGRRCLAAPLRTMTAEDMMTSPAVTVTEEVTLFKIMELFSAKGINRVPVVDDRNKLTGLVSRADIMKAPFAGLR
jgi:CBS domain-containing membrane protein